MATIVTRADKGSPLTHTEVDANFTNLNTDKVESSALATVATSGAYGDLSGLPTLGTAAATAATDYATAAQGALADSSTQPGDNVSTLTNDAGYSTTTGTVTNVGGTGAVNGLSLSGTVTSSGNLTLGGTLAISNADWSGTDLSVANGGTGASTLAANNVLLGNGASALQTVAPGASGNVLTSNGTTWQSTEPAGGGGGTVDFTASGAISNGDLVSINSDGTVSVTSGFGLVPTAFSPNSTEKSTPIYDTLNNKVVVCYRDTSDNYGKAVVGTVSGTSISFGTPVTFAATNAEDVHATFDSTNNKVVAIYRDASNSNYGTAVVGTVSGTSISFGSATVFESAEAATPYIAFDSNAGKVVVSYRDGGNSNYGTAVVGTVSGTSISFGTPVVFLSALTQNPFPVFDSNSNKMVILYKGNAGDGKAVVGTVSGTSISFGSEGQFDGTTIEQPAGAFDSTNNKIVVVYKNSSNIPKAGIGTVSGTSISFNTAVTISDDTVQLPKAAYNTAGGVVGVVFRSTSNSNYPTYVPLTVSGATLSVGTQALFGQFFSVQNDLCYDPDSEAFIHATRNNVVSDGVAQVYNPNANITGWVGVSTSDIADAASGTITIISGTNESQSGLTVGAKYYISDGGALSATENSGKEIGRALSATKLLITQGSVS